MCKPVEEAASRACMAREKQQVVQPENHIPRAKGQRKGKQHYNDQQHVFKALIGALKMKGRDIVS